MGIRGFSVAQLPVTLDDIDEVWDQAGNDSASNSGASAIGDRPRGSTSSSYDSLRSSEGGGGGGGEGGGGGRGGGTFPPEQAAVCTAKSAKAKVLEKAEVATVKSASLTASETAAQVAVTPSTSTSSDQSSQDDGEGGEITSGSGDSGEDDRQSGEREKLVGAAVAAEAAAADCANPEQSREVVVSSEDRGEADDSAPVQDETSVEDRKLTDFEATRTNEEPVSEGSIDNISVGGVDEGRKGQEKNEEECEIDQQANGPLEVENMEGGNGEGLDVTIEQDQKDRFAGSAVGAAERVAPTVETDDGVVLRREPIEGHAGAKTDKNNDVDFAITAAECVDESGATEKPATISPSEGVEDTPVTVLASDPDEDAMKHPIKNDTSSGTLAGGGSGDVGESPPPKETRPSPTLVDHTRMASIISHVVPLAAGESEQDSTGIQGIKNVGDDTELGHPQRLDDEKVIEKETREREQKAEGQAGGVGGKRADEDSVDTSPAEIGATSVSREGGVAEHTFDEKNAPLVPTRLWEFPPSFQALVTLSTASETVECTLEGEIAPELMKDDSRDKGARSWKSVYCLFKIAAGKGVNPPPQADIDLEDDEAQARLEDLLEREYGLAMEDVLERFSPDTDLGSSEAVVRSFTDSICQLRPSLVQPQNTKGEEGHDGGDRAVYKAVGAALRGGGEAPEWREMQVRVGESCVLEVGVTTTTATTTSSTTIEQQGQRKENDDDNENSESGTNNNSVVDCCGVVSPTALRPHLLSGGVPVSAVDALERARLVDLAGVLAALAQEAEDRKNVLAQSSPAIQKDEGEARGWPAVNPDRGGTQVLRLTSERRSGSLATMHECMVAVTGTSERFRLEISPVLVGDDAPSASAALTTISCLLPLDTSAVATEKGLRSETYGKNETRENSSARMLQPEEISSRKKAHNSEADTTGLNVGDRVEARFGGKTEWFPGTVRAINTAVHERDKDAPVGGSGVADSGSGRGGALRSNLPTVAIDYDDGDVEERVPRVRVRLPDQKQPRFLKEGDEVDVKRGKNISSARVVVRPSYSPREEGHYDLQLLDDGRRGVGGGGGAVVENCPRSAIMALHGWPPVRK